MSPMREAAAAVLVEREHELAEIDRVLADTLAGEGWLHTVAGPAGIGKTTLMRAARQRAMRAGLTVFAARGGELEGAYPYGVVRQLFEPVLRTATPSRRARLLAGAATPAAGVLLGPPDDGDGADQSFAALHGLYWLVVNLAAEAPVVILVDDLHWADRPSLRFLSYLTGRLDGLPATLLASVRTGESDPESGVLAELGQGPRAVASRPAPLTETAVASVLTADLARPPDPVFTEACWKATGGNPFLVRELATALRADAISPDAEAAPRLASTGPQAIARAILGRLGRLSPDAVELARAIAVLAGDADLPRAAALTGLDDRRALAALDALVGANVTASSSRLEFRHPIVRRAIYEELTPGRRSAVHQQIATLLSDEGAELDAVAGHLLLSEPTGSATVLELLRAAAAHAVAIGAPDSAARYLTRALQERPARELRADLLLELADAERLVGMPTALDHMQEAHRTSESPITRTRALIGLAWGATYVESRWDRGLELLDSAVQEIGDRDHGLLIAAEGLRATMTAYDPRLAGLWRARGPALRALIDSGGPGTASLQMLLACIEAAGLPGPERSPHEFQADIRARVDRAWDDGRFLRNGETMELLPQGLGALVFCGELDRAGEITDVLRAGAPSSGSIVQFLFVSGHDALIHTRRGELVAAAAELRSSCELATEHSLQFALLSMFYYGLEALLERPDIADIAALIEGIELGPMGDVMIGAMVLEARGRLRALAGDTTAAIEDLRRAGAISDGLSFANPNGYASWRSPLALMLGPTQPEEALALAGAELADARAVGQARGIGVALRTLGTLTHDPEPLGEAVALLADSPARLEYARALVEQGAALRRLNQRAAARDPLREGLDLAARCGALRLTERAGTELAATGARPRSAHITGRDALTPSELRVARMAATGRTSQDIAQELFVTTKTVDGHLNRSYTKLGINSRRQLAAALGSQEA
jgi:DNA-binding CsgD family transcriptional regulator